MGMRPFCSFYDFFLLCLRPPHCNVVANRSSGQPRFLQHHAKSASQIGPSHLPDINPFNFYCTAVHIIETHQKINQRCFPTSGGAHNRDTLPCLYPQIKILNQLFFRNIGKIHMLQRHIARMSRQLFCRFRIRRPGRRFQKLKYSARAGQCVLKLCHHA